jgi:endonuclease YncB( thermonuclease family)
MRAAAFALLLAGCYRSSGPPDAGPAPDASARDAARADAAAPDLDAAVDAAPQSECPPPPTVTPDTELPGYLAPVVVGYVRTVDGDTAHLRFESGDQTLRFLYVNTEEIHGEEATEFGEETARIVRGILEGATEIVAEVRESAWAAGQPDLDPYDRWLSLVFVDGELLQTRIVREGLSAYYTKYGCAPEPVHSSLLWAEAEANALDRGVWAPGHPSDTLRAVTDWIGRDHCRPDPSVEPYCP